MWIKQTTLLQLSLNQIIFFLITLMVIEGLFLYVWRYRKVVGAVPFLGCIGSRAFWVLGTFFKRFSEDVPMALFWSSVTDYASIFLAYFWAVFAVKISWQNLKPPGWLWGLIHSLLVLALLPVLTGNLHGQYMAKATIVERTFTCFLGPGFIVLFICAYALVFLGSILLWRWAYLSRGWRRQMLLLLSLSPFITLLGNILSFNPSVSSYFPFIIASLISQLYSAWVFYRWRLFSIQPFAQKAVVQNMVDGLLVIDKKGYIVEMNRVAAEILQGLPVDEGGDFETLCRAWPALAESVGTLDGVAVYGFRDMQNERRHYQLRIISLETDSKRYLGKAIIIKDITQEKRDQEKIIDQQKALAILTERNRLGREIHDGQGQIWSYLQLELQTLRTLYTSNKTEAAERQAERLNEILRSFNEDVRESIAGLKDTGNSDFMLTLQEYLTWYEKTYKIPINFVWSGEANIQLLRESRAVQLLRIIQEALTNIRKHANAGLVEIRVQKEQQQILVSIEDNGCGFEAAAIPSGKYGLGIMRERAEEAGFLFEVVSAAGTGTKVTLTFNEVKGNEPG